MVDVPTQDFAGYHGRNRPFPFCGRIIEVYYTNPNLDTVCVTYREDNDLTPDGEPRAYDYYMEVDEKDARFKALLEEVTYEQIETATGDRNQAYKEEFHQYVKEASRAYIEEQGLLRDLLESGDTADDVMFDARMALFDFVFNYNPESTKTRNDKEELFRLKLYMFETDVGQNAPREYKAEIRKSESPLAAFAAFYQAEKALRENDA
jgi:hypothetical protein|tara:strand:- start:67 stop:687 length:621 start_codon:yes stop_codon:yes gene_type:complete